MLAQVVDGAEEQVESFVVHEPADVADDGLAGQAEPVRQLLVTPARGEARGVDAVGHHRDPPGVHAQPDHLAPEGLGDHEQRVGLACDRPLELVEVGAPRRGGEERLPGVLEQLLQTAHLVDEGQTHLPRGAQPRHPDVVEARGVDQPRPAVAGQVGDAPGPLLDVGRERRPWVVADALGEEPVVRDAVDDVHGRRGALVVRAPPQVEGEAQPRHGGDVPALLGEAGEDSVRPGRVPAGAKGERLPEHGHDRPRIGAGGRRGRGRRPPRAGQ